MARPQHIDDEALIAALADVFRDYGYEGASLVRLAEASGLQKASLYHRFPGGKEQMATEVLAAAFNWLEAKILAPMRGDGSPAERLNKVTAELRAFYDCGRKGCLLNMLSSAKRLDGPFAERVRSALKALIGAFASLARENGQDPRTARRRAESVVAQLQGSLVLSRGLGECRPFERFLKDLPTALLGSADDC